MNYKVGCEGLKIGGKVGTVHIQGGNLDRGELAAAAASTAGCDYPKSGLFGQAFADSRTKVPQPANDHDTQD
jgi:hypothetical protein